MPSSDSRNVGGYQQSDQTHEYEYETGLVALPLAKREPGHKIIRVHGGFGMRRVKWSAQRSGNPPIIPAMADTSGDVFLGGVVAPQLPRPSTDNRGYDWKTSGEYVFVQSTPRVAGTSHFPVGSHPFYPAAQAAEAARLVGNSINSLIPPQDNDGGAYFQSAVTILEDTIKIRPDGSYTWPVLALPTIFASTHILQD